MHGLLADPTPIVHSKRNTLISSKFEQRLVDWSTRQHVQYHSGM